MSWQHATPMRSFAIMKALVNDERFVKLSAKAQAALLVAVIHHADHNGWWRLKAKTLANEVGRSDRRVRDAINECVAVGLIVAARQRRPDGTLGVYDFELDDVITHQADENVRLWTRPSSGTSADKSVRSASADESVRARTALNGSMNGSAGDGTADAVAGDHAQWWLDNIGIEFAHDARAFAEEAASAIRLSSVEAETIRLALLQRGAT